MAILQLTAGFILLFISGNQLVKSSIDIARHLRISTLTAGLTFAAFGTSAPELFVSVKAAYTGVSDLAIGNIAGSNIANIGLIIGSVALIAPISLKNPGIWFDWAVMVVATLMLMIFSYNGYIGILEGIVMLLSLSAYIFWIISKSRNINQKRVIDERIIPSKSIIHTTILLLISSVGLYLGADLLVNGATSLASSWGVSDRVIGVSVVAFGTSIPELATSLTAVIKKENDISAGNIIGSNIFNIWAVLGVTSIITPLPVNDALMLTVDLIWSLIFAIMLLLFILPLRDGKITRLKGSLLFLLYISYIYIVISDIHILC
ncbi:calcium/sodium antiporter [Marinilabiliaceae bacterium ANBcel2]|nr:calcium/sodium antiporter [Marinilabiliaceae bacterium ANBcel2]